MKRHTIFIYTAALLTMLGTALPMSAQNKSFTVNRNDGASQKYSYSQGDRLVLSREDSQGKKHDDFVEQQVHVGNAVHNIPLTSIESITFDTHATEDEGKTFTVQESGGKIEYDDITIDFPSGTFNSSTKVTVSEVEKGKIDGDLELSTYYQVKLSGGVSKSIKVAIKSPEYANDDNVKLQFVTPAWIPSGATTGEAHSLIDVKYEKDSYVAEISPMDSPEEINNMTVSFGLVSYPTLDMVSSRMTRAGDDDFAVLWNHHWGFDEAKINRKMQDSWIPDVIAKIAVLGFELDPLPFIPKTIKYIVRWLDDPDKWGECTHSGWAVVFNTVEVNYTKLMQLGASGNPTELEKTLIHETLHYYQAHYDPRSAYTVASVKGSTALILDEATAVWSERFYGDRLSNLTKFNVPDFIATSNPENRYIYDVTDKNGNSYWPRRYEAVGYGMSALIEYLSQRINSKIVIEMYNKKKRKERDVYDSRGIVEDVANAHGIDIFSQTGYKDFIEQLGCGKVYPNLTFSQIMKLERKKQGSVGKVRCVITEFGKSENFNNLAFGYGALIESLQIAVDKLDGSLSDVLDNVSGIIEQKKDGLKTWVYAYRDQEFYPIGMTKKGSPLDISNSFHKNSAGTYSIHNYFFVTIKDNFKDDTEIESNIEAKIEKVPDASKIGIVLYYDDEEGNLRELRTPDFTDHKEATERSISWLPVDVTMNKDNTIATITGFGKLPWRVNYETIGDQYCDVKIELYIEPVDKLVYAIHKLKGSVIWNSNVEDDSRKFERSANYDFDVECYKMQEGNNIIKYFMSSGSITDLLEKENFIDYKDSENSSNKTYRMGSNGLSPNLTIYLNLDPSTMK